MRDRAPRRLPPFKRCDWRSPLPSQFRDSVIPQTDKESPSSGLATCPSSLLAPVKCRLLVARRLIKEDERIGAPTGRQSNLRFIGLSVSLEELCEHSGKTCAEARECCCRVSN